VPFVPVLIGLLAVGVALLVALGLRLRSSLRRFGMVRGWLADYLTDRTGMLRARYAALGVAVTTVKQHQHRNRLTTAAPRTIRGSVEQEDNRGA
jgi:hypothetical protein